MTLDDLLQLIRRYWKLGVLLPIACLLVSIVCTTVMAGPQFVATAKLVLVDPTGTVSSEVLMATVLPIAQESAADCETMDTAVVVVEPKAGSTAAGSRTLTFEATGSSPDEAINSANEAAEAAAEEGEAVFSRLTESIRKEQDSKRDLALEALSASGSNIEALVEAAVSDRDFSNCTFTVIRAVTATDSKVDAKKVAVVAIVVGLFFYLVIIVLIDIMKKPLKSREEVTALSGWPLLAWSYAPNFGNLLWGNILLASKEVPKCVALLPINGEGDRGLAATLIRAIDAERDASAVIRSLESSSEGSKTQKDVSVLDLPSIYIQISSAFEAKTADAVVVYVHLWEDTRTQLEFTIKELALAGIRVTGVAVCA